MRPTEAKKHANNLLRSFRAVQHMAEVISAWEQAEVGLKNLEAVTATKTEEVAKLDKELGKTQAELDKAGSQLVKVKADLKVATEKLEDASARAHQLDKAAAQRREGMKNDLAEYQAGIDEQKQQLAGELHEMREEVAHLEARAKRLRDALDGPDEPEEDENAE